MGVLALPNAPHALAAIRAVVLASQGDRALSDVLGQVCREVAQTLEFDRVGISRIETGSAGDVAVGLAGFGVDEETAKAQWVVADTPMFARALESGELVYVADARAEPSLPAELVDRLGVTSLFTLPLISEGRCIGFLSGDRAGVRFRLSDDEIDLLNTVAILAATLLEKELLREEMRRLDAAKTQFIAFASHELRTPIQTVYGVLATLHHRGGQLAEEQRVELRATAFGQAERLRRLVDQLLDLSRIDAAAVAVSPVSTHMRSLLEEIVLIVAERDAPSIEIAAPDDLEAPVDRGAIERILSNLLANALLYGAPPVRIEAAQVDRHLRIKVEDCGRGVAPEFLPQLFERFERSNDSAESEQGSGLGLSIALAYARAHGGDVVYHDVIPHGACFEFVLPVEA